MSPPCTECKFFLLFCSYSILVVRKFDLRNARRHALADLGFDATLRTTGSRELVRTFRIYKLRERPLPSWEVPTLITPNYFVLRYFFNDMDNHLIYVARHSHANSNIGLSHHGTDIFTLSDKDFSKFVHSRNVIKHGDFLPDNLTQHGNRDGFKAASLHKMRFLH
ncbi:Multistep phosphorelay regulator 1 [Fusarium oxysporum f. sp. albedinis]|nr:Multistep phosphorelay regulator 1 [Fusarium oxysporum f. sp. albedinis]